MTQTINEKKAREFYVQEVINIIADKVICNPEDFTEETYLLDDYMDELDMVELAVQIENNLNIHIPDAECSSWQTVKDVVDTYIKYQRS